MTIKILEMYNFESHKSTQIEFNEGVNSITGLSGYGKSSIVRAIRWAVKNDPNGESMISHFAKGNTVSAIEFDDGSWIVRTRGSKVNQYEVSGEEKPFNALRGKVPEQIEIVSNMDDTNFQRQKDFYFMLNDSPGIVARMFNKVSGLGDMDDALAEVNGRYKEKKRKMDSLSDSHDRITAELKELNWVKDADKDWSKIEEIDKSLIQIEDTIIRLEALIDTITDIQTQIDSWDGLEVLSEIEKIFAMEEDYFEIEDKINKLSNNVKTISSINDQIRNSKVPTDEELMKLEQVLKEIETIDDLLSRIYVLKQQISIYTADMADAEVAVNELQYKLDTLIGELGICEACNGTGFASQGGK